MTFHLRSQESVADGLRRVAAKELQSARDELRRTTAPGEEAIHEARKSIKKVRAVTELIEADDGRGLTGCRKRLRKVSHTLSELRDADVMLETLTKVRKRNANVFSEHGFARERRRLSLHKQALLKAAQDDGAWKTVDRELRNLRRDAERWRPRHRRFGALAAGIEVTYRRGRKALARARKHQRAADFHEWRKHIKALWYQLRLLEQTSPHIRHDVRLLHRAETWLGDEHNVVVLCAQLSKDASLCDLDRLRHVANRYQCELRGKAIASAGLIYSRAPGVYLDRVKRASKSWPRHKRRSRVRRPRRAAA